MSSIPEPAAAAAMSPPPLALKPREERRLHAGHLWIFSNEVDVEATPLTAFAPGEVVQVRSSADRFLGYAYVNPKTLISARLLSRDPDHPPGRSLLVHRLKVALGLRSRFHAAPFYRLVYGEGDLLPGLVPDQGCLSNRREDGRQSVRSGLTRQPWPDGKVAVQVPVLVYEVRLVPEIGDAIPGAARCR